MTKRFSLALAIVCAIPVAAQGQVAPPPARVVPPPGGDGWTPRAPGAQGQHQVVPSFDHLLFPPELVMQHQRALELTAEQRRVITDAVKSLQNQTVDLQWNLQAEQAALSELLEKRPINEQAVVAKVTTLLELEAGVKRTHMAALVRIKNALNEQQIDQLTKLRSRGFPMHYDRDFEEYFELIRDSSIGRAHDR